MKSCILLLRISLFLASVARALPQQSPDPKASQSYRHARFKALTPAELNQLLSKAGQETRKRSIGWAFSTRRKGTEEFGKKAVDGLLKICRNREMRAAQLAYGTLLQARHPSIAERVGCYGLRSTGHTETQFWLGVGYEQEWFGTVYIEEAIKWYRKAAEGGDPDPQVELGQKYEGRAKAWSKDYKLAAECYRKAGMSTFPNLGGAGQGRNRLGLLYMQGLGVFLRTTYKRYFWLVWMARKEMPPMQSASDACADSGSGTIDKRVETTAPAKP